MAGSDYEHCAACGEKAFYAGDVDTHSCVIYHEQCAPVLRLDEVWAAGPNAEQLPAGVMTNEGLFYEDGVTPLEITDDMMRAAGWKKMSRLVTEWVEE